MRNCPPKHHSYTLFYESEADSWDGGSDMFKVYQHNWIPLQQDGKKLIIILNPCC